MHWVSPPFVPTPPDPAMAQWPYAGAVASHGAGGVIPHGMDVGYSGGSQGSHGGYMDYATLSSPQLSPLHAPDNLGLGFAPLPPSAEPDDLRVGLGGIGAGMTVDSSFSALPPGWRASAQPPASHGNRAMLSGDAGHVHHNDGSHGTSSLVMAGALAQHNDDQHKRFTLTISPSGKRRGQPPRARVRSTPVTPSVELPPCFLGGPRGGHCGEGCHTVLLDYPAHAPLDKVADGRCFALVPPRRQGDQATPSTPVRCAKKNLKPYVRSVNVLLAAACLCVLRGPVSLTRGCAFLQPATILQAPRVAIQTPAGHAVLPVAAWARPVAAACELPSLAQDTCHVGHWAVAKQALFATETRAG